MFSLFQEYINQKKTSVTCFGLLKVDYFITLIQPVSTIKNKPNFIACSEKHLNKTTQSTLIKQLKYNTKLNWTEMFFHKETILVYIAEFKH